MPTNKKIKLLVIFLFNYFLDIYVLAFLPFIINHNILLQSTTNLLQYVEFFTHLLLRIKYLAQHVRPLTSNPTNNLGLGVVIIKLSFGRKEV